jgi:NADH:ubiquinone oxidoreductase subunit 3 (subunit A)
LWGGGAAVTRAAIGLKLGLKLGLKTVLTPIEISPQLTDSNSSLCKKTSYESGITPFEREDIYVPIQKLDSWLLLVLFWTLE